MEFLRKIFGTGAKVNYRELVKEGGIIVDVRTPGEYKSGHIKGSINIPLGTLENSLSRLKKDKCIITCCASGMRSASAKRILKAHGYAEVYNGGGWMSL
jgi:rhodanese-related sulfurtransferase